MTAKLKSRKKVSLFKGNRIFVSTQDIKLMTQILKKEKSEITSFKLNERGFLDIFELSSRIRK
jgi:hypothetical protein